MTQAADARDGGAGAVEGAGGADAVGAGGAVGTAKDAAEVAADSAEVAADESIPADIEVLSGRPDDDEMAAITAVLAGVLEELAEEQGRRAQAATSAWARSQRSLRAPLHPGTGVWRTFSG